MNFDFEINLEKNYCYKINSHTKDENITMYFKIYKIKTSYRLEDYLVRKSVLSMHFLFLDNDLNQKILLLLNILLWSRLAFKLMTRDPHDPNHPTR